MWLMEKFLSSSAQSLCAVGSFCLQMLILAVRAEFNSERSWSWLGKLWIYEIMCVLTYFSYHEWIEILQLASPSSLFLPSLYFLPVFFTLSSSASCSPHPYSYFFPLFLMLVFFWSIQGWYLSSNVVLAFLTLTFLLHYFRLFNVFCRNLVPKPPGKELHLAILKLFWKKVTFWKRGTLASLTV